MRAAARRPGMNDSPTDSSAILSQLVRVLEQRRRNPPARSYTAQLMEGGVDAIGAKIREEAEEAVEAAGQAGGDTGSGPLVHEAADLLYHLLVLLVYCGADWGDVERELGRRFGTSGLDEKEGRRQPTDRSP